MFSRVNFKASFEAISPDGDESDDNISVTSTVSGHDPEQEFGVENILAEHRFEDGEMYYLVEWTGFQLHESTWEAEANLGADLKAMWEEDKAKHATGELESFDVQKFYDALLKANAEKKERHRRRNAKREKLGLPLTAPFDKDKDSSDEEAVEESRIEAEASEPAPVPRPPKPQNVLRRVPSSGPAAIVGSSRPQDEPRQSSTSGQELQTDVDTSSLAKRKQTAHVQTTGYQGTARKPNKDSTNAAPKSKTRLAISIPTSIPTAAAPSIRPAPRARKTLMAKKSTTQPTGNIFTSGKIRKQRGSLKDVMSDATKSPKLFDKHRYRRLAQLGSRGKEDAAPDISQIRLLDLRSGQPFARQSSGGSILSPTQLSPQEEGPSPLEPPLASALISPRSTLVGPNAAPPRKKRKSVRFLEDDGDQSALVQEPEQMDLDSPVTQGPSRAYYSPPPRRRPSLDRIQGPPSVQGTQSSEKKLILGKSAVEAIFYGLPRDPSSQRAWLADFLAKETLEFRHSCHVKTTASQIGTLIQKPLASGPLVSQEGDQSLEQVAEYLAAGLLALYHGQSEFKILVYATKCEEWKSLLSHVQEPTSPSEAALGYLIFASAQDCRLMLPPLAPLSGSQPGIEDCKTKTKKQDATSARELVMKRFFGFDYNKLLPAMQKRPIDNFFLAIPDSRREVGLALFHWLRASNPACQIFTSHHAGSWDAFRARVEVIPGVVIIHETLAWSLRRLPHLSRYLITRNDEYWCISEPVHDSPLYPSISVSEYPVPPGDMHFTRLFPYRTAIFLTPSFLVSEPRRALEFLEWFMKKWAANFHFRLVTAHNIHEYMAELAEERYQARKDLLNSPGDMLPEMEANLSGLSKEDCGFRYAAANVATDMHIAREAKAGPFAHDEDNSSLVYADSLIDPNDEQSLINWFGWWATLRADQFRKFHVIGSSQAIKLHGCTRGELRVRIPKYSKVTLNDPDAVLEVIQERNDQLDASEAEANGGDTSRQVSANGARQSGFRKGPWSFRSNLIKMEDADCFAAYMDSLTTLDGFRKQWLLYRFPVSWLDLSMAEYFGDFTSKFPRIQDWFNFTFPFGACYKDGGSGGTRPFHGYNTYFGLFYTIDKEWDGPEGSPPPKPVERHPWIAIYRPVNPHRKPYGRCEVVIWDPAARTRYPNGEAPAEKDLIFMQRQLIEHVRDHGDQKNNGTWLDQVWFGGWDWPADCDSQYPLDVTLLFLRRVLENIREFMPAPEHVMESKGYQRVALGPASPSPAAHATAVASNAADDDDSSSSLFVRQNTGYPEDVPMDIDTPSPDITKFRTFSFPAGQDKGDDEEEEEEEDDDEDTRIIFHPPRGHTNNSNNHKRGGRSRCVNRLYEEARLARARAATNGAAADTTTHMRYRFVPTTDWYREQRAEGRGYAHVNVDSWEGVFNILKVGDGARAAGGGGGGAAGGGEKRGSVGSG
ncbi:hypothetical protein C8A00DRAFT_18911 [Chaetomidium leptoderma]|uniref:Chromo domain-containing protein n=1 Tax=Chaetomidium leptoderma TaxID=669021 RepID=A0AAN6VF50_9PEZI|nr:hypothetical protein C8A00DRAFT_18911 [Chaetomidium leptoderma]